MLSFLLTFKNDSVGLELNWRNILNSTDRWPFTDSWKWKIFCFGLKQLQRQCTTFRLLHGVVKQLQVITGAGERSVFKMKSLHLTAAAKSSMQKGEMVPMNKGR